MPAVHPGLWHPTLIAKMAACLDRLTTGRSAINLVTGWNEVEARMYGGDILLHEDDRYIRAEEFVRCMRGMWSETPFSFDGRFYQVKESQLLHQARDRAAAGDLHRQPQRRAGWRWWRNTPTGGSSTTTRARPTSPASRTACAAPWTA